jgi:hypothetical protein
VFNNITILNIATVIVLLPAIAVIFGAIFIVITTAPWYVSIGTFIWLIAAVIFFSHHLGVR